LALDSLDRTLLKARLAPEPEHYRALPLLLQGLALWQGQRIRAVLVADTEVCTSGMSLYRRSFDDGGGEPLYQLEYALSHEHHPGSGLGRFADLRRFLDGEVVR
jgi:hypothetical protein